MTIHRDQPEAARVVTAEQLKAGYVTFAGGTVMRHAYDVLWKNADGTFTVVEPVIRTAFRP